jgi:transcriptional regulator with XRE-family HTH domain
LRDAHKYVGLSQEEAVANLKLPRTALTDIESGQRKVEALELKRMAELYRQPVSHFTGEHASAAPLRPMLRIWLGTLRPVAKRS